MMRVLTVEPLISGSLWLTLAAAGAVLLAWYAVRRPMIVSRRRWGAIIVLMGVAFALVMGVLLNPTWVKPVPPPAGKPLVSILVDASASMATRDGPEGRSRYQQAAEMASRLSRQLPDFDVRLRTFGETVLPAGASDLASRKPEGRSTDIAAAIAGALDEDRAAGQAMIILSDGIHNVSGSNRVLEAVQSARAMAAPIYTRVFGRELADSDVAVELRSTQDLAFVGQKAAVAVHLRQTGFKGARAEVSLWRDGKELERQAIDLGEAVASVRFLVGQDKVGVYCYQVRVDPLPGEMTQANNTASYLLRVVDRPVRVMLLEGRPYWDNKFLVRTMSSVPAIELQSIVRLTDSRLMQRSFAATQPSATHPAQTQPAMREGTWQILTSAADVLAKPEALKNCQIVVLGRDTESYLTEAAVSNVQRWISREGGSLVCYRGPPTAQVNDRLGKLLPVKWTPRRETRFHMKLTESGQEMKWLSADAAAEGEILAGLPTLASNVQLDKSKPLAVVLASGLAPGGDESPAVVYQPYGAGRVVVIEGAGMWRWAFLAPQHQQDEPVFDTIWQSLLRWLVSGVGLLPGQEMALRSDAIGFGPTDSASATLLVREELARAQLPQVELLRGGTLAGTYSPAAVGGDVGTYRVDFGKLPEGSYEARVAGGRDADAAVRTAFEVRSVGREQLDLKARGDLMQRMAADSGGAVLSDLAADEVGREFRAYQNRIRPPRVQRITAWDRWWILAGALALWGVCWAVRRRGGLV